MGELWRLLAELLQDPLLVDQLLLLLLHQEPLAELLLLLGQRCGPEDSLCAFLVCAELLR